MNLFYKNNLKQSNNSVMSATRPQDTILKTNSKQEIITKLQLKQKKIIKIYIDEDKLYVEHGAAYALGLIKTRSVMLDNPKLIEISSSMHDKLKTKDDIDIEYIKIEKKAKLKVYIDSSNYYVDSAAAYALGWLSVEQYSSLENEYYCIDKNILNNLMESYDVEFFSLNLQTEISKKR